MMRILIAVKLILRYCKAYKALNASFHTFVLSTDIIQPRFRSV